MTESRHAYTAVVLAGGRARRLGGTDKTRLDVGGRSILARVLAAVSAADAVVVVGDPGRSEAVSKRVTWVCEEPPGGGPVAGLAAAMPEVDTDVIVLLAGDQPFLQDVPEKLLRALDHAPQSDAVVPVDAQGRAQPLAATYRSAAVRRFLAAQPAVHGLAMRALLGALTVATLPAEDFGPKAFTDVDTAEDLAAARRRADPEADRHPEQEDPMLDDWTQALADELGIEMAVDTELLLDLAKDAAHAVARPAAPVTTFLVGFAAARAGGSAADVQAASATARRLAAGWQPRAEPE